MANRDFKGQVRTLESAIVKLYGNLTFGASGAITDDSKGFSVAKTATETGRYTVTLEDKYSEFMGCNVTVVGPDDSAATTADGYWTFVRNEAVASSTFDIQFVRTDTGADANPTSGNIAHLEITLKNSSNTY